MESNRGQWTIEKILSKLSQKPDFAGGLKGLLSKSDKNKLEAFMPPLIESLTTQTILRCTWLFETKASLIWWSLSPAVGVWLNGNLTQQNLRFGVGFYHLLGQVPAEDPKY